MGLFGKKKEEKKEAPRLPELPTLPELPKMEEVKDQDYKDKEKLPQLPSFPSNSIGQKFSQDAIKEAVTGGKEVEEVNSNELGKIEVPEMNLPLTKEMDINESSKIQNIPKEFVSVANKSKEPIFIRIDKFEESLKTFEKTKEKISELNKLLSDIKDVKEKEEQELTEWEIQLQGIKNQIEKVDREIFSRVE